MEWIEGIESDYGGYRSCEFGDILWYRSIVRLQSIRETPRAIVSTPWEWTGRRMSSFYGFLAITNAAPLSIEFKAFKEKPWPWSSSVEISSFQTTACIREWQWMKKLWLHFGQFFHIFSMSSTSDIAVLASRAFYSRRLPYSCASRRLWETVNCWANLFCHFWLLLEVFSTIMIACCLTKALESYV